MSLCCTLGYKWLTVMHGVKNEFNGIIPLYTKRERGDALYQPRKFLYYIYIIIKTVAGKLN